jgi:hypothetical protein
LCEVFKRSFNSIHTGKTGDLDCYRSLNLNLPPNSEILGDKAYNDLQLEQDCKNLPEFQNLKLNPIRKRKTKQMYNSDYCIELGKRIERRPIETLFSQVQHQDTSNQSKRICNENTLLSSGQIHPTITQTKFTHNLGYQY